MSSFFSRFRPSITGVLSGFDRLVFRGHLRSLTYLKGIRQFFWDRQVLFKDFTAWAKLHTDRVKDEFAQQAAKVGQKVEYLRSPSLQKEPLARKLQAMRKINCGPVASFICVEPCRTWEIRKDRETKRLSPVIVPGQCLHLYRYFDHPRFGFMHVRLQTWLPFTIQVCMNGREFLRRSLEQAHIGFTMRDNCFTAIKDWTRAQTLLDGMLDLDWIPLLSGAPEFLPVPGVKLVDECVAPQLGQCPEEQTWRVHMDPWGAQGHSKFRQLKCRVVCVPSMAARERSPTGAPALPWL